MPKSDIKICISSGINHGETLDDVPLLDTILLQVGPLLPANEDLDTPDFQYPYLAFKLTVPRSQMPIMISGFRMGLHLVDTDLGYENNFDIARNRLRDCKSFYRSCLTNVYPELPSRVIDISTDGSYVNLLSSTGFDAEYVALSRCWRGPITPVLDTARLIDSKKALPFDDLPLNFQHAIHITRRLSIQYLWIDSLCIFQDSRVDWEQQSEHMNSICRNSTVTLSALASAGSGSGVLPCVSAAVCRESQSVDIKLFSDLIRESRMVRMERKHGYEEDLKSLQGFGPLVTTGWCLQEAILPPRQLYFGLRQIYWRCPLQYSSADGITSGMRVPETRYEHMSRVLHAPALSCPTDISNLD